MNIYSEDKMYESYSSEVERMQKCIDELQQENKQIKIQISAREEVCDRLEEENKKYKNQQKEFIEYMNKTIKELECDDFDDEEIKGYLIQRIDTFKEILSKYKEIIGE